MEQSDQEITIQEKFWANKTRGLNVDILIDTSKISDEQKALVGETLDLFRNMQDDMESALIAQVERFAKDFGRNYQKIIDLLAEKKLAQPKFMIFDEKSLDSSGNKIPESVKSIIKRYPSFGQRNPSHIYAVFELPPPLSHWWYKGKGSWGGTGKELDDMVLSWGTIYRDTLPLIWDHLDEPGQLDVEKLSDNFEHVPGEFYYVWGITSAQQEPIGAEV